MKNTVKRTLAIILCAAIAACLFTGCAVSATAAAQTERMTDTEIKETELHVAVVLGSHWNAPRVNLGLIENAVYDACRSFGKVTLIVDDGDPVYTVIDIPKQEARLSANKLKSIADGQAQQIMDSASRMHSLTAEVDSMKAIQLAARALNTDVSETGKRVEKRLIVLDSLLATTGVLSFSEHHLNGIDIDNIVGQLSDKDEIPNLTGVAAYVYTCGDTAEPQTPLTEANRKTLKELWNAILTAAGADVTMKDELPLTTVYDEAALPTVTPVTVVADSVEITNAEQAKEVFNGGAVMSFGEETVRFSPGTAELADHDEAEKSLESVIQCLEENPDMRLLICGTTANFHGEENCRIMSRNRAETVKRLICSKGIDESRLAAVGVGYSFPDFYTNDLKPDGTLDETIAPQNRTVKLVDLNSDTAARILAFLEEVEG